MAHVEQQLQAQEAPQTQLSEGVTQSVHTLVFNHMRKARDMFISEYAEPIAQDPVSETLRRNVKAKQEYGSVIEMSKSLHFKSIVDEAKRKAGGSDAAASGASDGQPGSKNKDTTGAASLKAGEKIDSKALVAIASSKQIVDTKMRGTTQALVKKRLASFIAPKWHAPWKLYRVVAGHTGWVRCAAVEPNNEWFATGSNDRTIKIWDLATGNIKLTYTGHVSSVRDICVAKNRPYLFSAGEDKTVKCWDLEQNRVVRHYHGHISAVNKVMMHPTLDIGGEFVRRNSRSDLVVTSSSRLFKINPPSHSLLRRSRQCCPCLGHANASKCFKSLRGKMASSSRKFRDFRPNRSFSPLSPTPQRPRRSNCRHVRPRRRPTNNNSLPRLHRSSLGPSRRKISLSLNPP